MLNFTPEPETSEGFSSSNGEPSRNGTHGANGKAPHATEGAGKAGGKYLSEKHLADLLASGLDRETIRIAGIYTELDPECISKLLGWDYPASKAGSALVIPFPTTSGEPTTYFRLKLDNPITHKNSDKPAKYESPRGKRGRVYLPPRARAVAKDVTVPAVYVEGEKKSLCGDQHGHVTIGLVGVFGWVKPREEGEPERDDDKPKPLHEDLEAFDWGGRRVYICFDSDAAYKPGVRYAEWELARSLRERGADVRIVRLPAKLGGEKVGLDDFIVQSGPKAFEVLLGKATHPTLPPQGFSNVSWRPEGDKAIPIARSLEEMAIEVVGRSEWPCVVSNALAVPDDAKGIRTLKSHHELFAYLGSVFDENGESRVCWTKVPGAATPQVFFSYLLSECQRYERAETLPHVPPRPDVLYLNPTPEPDGKYEALGEFLDFFSPATDEDTSLILAALLTPFWGGPPGARPAFLFEAEEDDLKAGRGVGKSTAARKLAAVSGGFFSIDAKDTFARTKSRLLTPDAGNYRVLLMDNIKTFRLSFAELEELITSPVIDGHRYYHGQAGLPNYFTLFLTLNGASLSKDVAQRVIPIRLSRRKYHADWESRLDSFLHDRRAQLVADIVGVLRSRPAKLKDASRWSLWEADVLARVERPESCMKVIEQRTEGMDADRDDGYRIRDAWIAICARSLGCQNPQEKQLLLRSSAVTKLVEVALNDRYSAAAASAQMRAIAPPGFRKSDRNGTRLWLWQGDKCRPDERAGSPPVVAYDPERQEWSTEVVGDAIPA